MRNIVLLVFAALVIQLRAQDKPTIIDTSGIIPLIEKRMTMIDDAPVKAVFLQLPGKEEAVRLLPDSAVLGSPIERDELYSSPDGTIVGMGIFLRSTHTGVTENSCYYFDHEGNTIAAWWKMKWTVSGCTDTVAIETRYIYFFPPGETLTEYATLTDAGGHNLDPNACHFPDIERHFDAYTIWN